MSFVKEDHVLAPRSSASEPVRPPVAARRPPARGVRQLLDRAVVPYLSRQVQRVGGIGVAGLALLVFAVAFFAGAIAPLKGELTELQASLAQARHSHDGPRVSTLPAAVAETQAFVGRLPLRSDLPALTGQIVQQASLAGITLERGTYDFVVTHSGKLVRARMAFPVHGRYPDIRRFIDGTLVAIPGAAIDGLRFERKSVGDTEVDADIRFALYLRSGS
jgi:hypothetical protein